MISVLPSHFIQHLRNDQNSEDINFFLQECSKRVQESNSFLNTKTIQDFVQYILMQANSQIIKKCLKNFRKLSLIFFSNKKQNNKIKIN